MNPHHIVIVGGGAAGLSLATRLGHRLGHRLGRRGRAQITLIDRQRVHFWKPHLHELAAGRMDLGRHGLSFMAHAHRHGFVDRIGELIGLDRERRMLRLAPHRDEAGRAVTPERELPYDTLVLALGSVCHDFGTPGVREHALALDSPAEADRFQRALVNACIRAQAQTEPLRPEQLQIVIVGAGATGVELAAELRHAGRYLARFGLERLAGERPLGIHLVEAGPRVLPALPERLAWAAQAELQAQQVQVHTGARVARVEADRVTLADGRHLPAELVVWAAGVKAPAVLRQLDGLATNALNQVCVHPTLQSHADPAVFALGDCAACPWLGRPGQWVPPRAQAAQQQARHLADNLERRLRGEPLRPWRYRDLGSLVSLGEWGSVGVLMGSLCGGRLWLSGRLAWWMYRSLYQQHQLTLHGWVRVLLDGLAHSLSRGGRPRIKLH